MRVDGTKGVGVARRSSSHLAFVSAITLAGSCICSCVVGEVCEEGEIDDWSLKDEDR